jgi:D-glycero-D-manno-heptose 1,7-bisphosphate phosphatase
MPAVLLDRDGTIIEDVGYLDRLERVSLFPWSADTIRALNRAGFVVAVVTNQSGIAKGLFDEAFVEETHRQVSRLLAPAGARVDAYYYCPHHPTGVVERYRLVCDCRKPASGLIRQAVKDLGLDPQRSFVVGDRWLDVAAGRAEGLRAILVRTGAGSSEERRPEPGLTADAIVDNLAAAASWILQREGGTSHAEP